MKKQKQMKRKKRAELLSRSTDYTVKLYKKKRKNIIKTN